MSFGSLDRTAYCGAGFGTSRTTSFPKLVEKKAGAFGGKLVNSSGGTYPGTAGSAMKPLGGIDGPNGGLCGTKADRGVRACNVRNEAGDRE